MIALEARRPICTVATDDRNVSGVVADPKLNLLRRTNCRSVSVGFWPHYDCRKSTLYCLSRTAACGTATKATKEFSSRPAVRRAVIAHQTGARLERARNRGRPLIGVLAATKPFRELAMAFPEHS